MHGARCCLLLRDACRAELILLEGQKMKLELSQDVVDMDMGDDDE